MDGAPGPTGKNACQDPGSCYDGCAGSDRDPSGSAPGLEREEWRSGLSSHASQPEVLLTSREGVEGVFFLTNSPRVAQHQPVASPHPCSDGAGLRRSAAKVLASSPSPLRRPPPRPQMLGLVLRDAFPPLRLAGAGGSADAQRRTSADAFFPRSGRVFPPCTRSPAARLASPHLCFITGFPAAGIPADRAGFILFSLLFVRLLLVFLLGVAGGGMRPRLSPPAPLRVRLGLRRQGPCQVRGGRMTPRWIRCSGAGFLHLPALFATLKSIFTHSSTF